MLLFNIAVLCSATIYSLVRKSDVFKELLSLSFTLWEEAVGLF
jgi:hypothetical protein